MKIVCATNMPFAGEAFRTLGETTIVEGRGIRPEQVRDAEILAVRSTSKINRALLDGSRVRFVGTATIGTDHMDIPWLEERGIRWCFAPGCNANSVSEYLVTALLTLAHRHGYSLAGKTIGVVGIGNVGRRVVEKMEALGLRVLPNDPPREEAEGAGAGLKFVPLETLLRESDIVTLHVPLTKSGRHPTAQMAGEDFFRRLKPGCIFVNAARGGLMNTRALLAAMDSGVVRHAVIDTWEGEPAYSCELLARVDIASPHIAGHSFEGKVNGTAMVYQDACRFLGVPAAWSADGALPPPPVPELTVDAAGRRDDEVLWELAHQVYDIEGDDLRLRSGSVPDEVMRAKHFDRLRESYPMRREFPYTRVTATGASPSLLRTIAGLGFRL